MGESEQGLKWWLRYVIVPLIGGGGLVAIVVAYLGLPQSPQHLPSSSSQVSQAPQDSTALKPESPKTVKSQAQPGVSATVETISSGVQITGKVIGLTDAVRKSHNIVVYVKTDKWYIHPYASGGDGKSWASIASDGSWQIRTVKREFPASSIAALVVPSNSAAPSTAETLGDIPSLAAVEKRLEGTPDFGKL